MSPAAMIKTSAASLCAADGEKKMKGLRVQFFQLSVFLIKRGVSSLFYELERDEKEAHTFIIDY